MAHVTGVGNQNLALAKRIGASGSLSFSYLAGVPSPEQAEAVLIRTLGVSKFANLRRETDPADWT